MTSFCLLREKLGYKTRRSYLPIVFNIFLNLRLNRKESPLRDSNFNKDSQGNLKKNWIIDISLVKNYAFLQCACRHFPYMINRTLDASFKFCRRCYVSPFPSLSLSLVFRIPVTVLRIFYKSHRVVCLCVCWSVKQAHTVTVKCCRIFFTIRRIATCVRLVSLVRPSVWVHWRGAEKVN